MARNGSGTYTRVSNSFTAPIVGEVISPTDADAFWDELETEMTDSLSRSGKGGMSADLDMNNNDINEIQTAVFQGATSGTATVAAPAIAGTVAVTLPSATGTLATTSNKLSAFAATTSLELKGVISDETGSGALVFATSPTLVTPVLGAATATTINGAAVAPGQISAVSSNTAATSGNIGEIVSTTVLAGSAVSMTTATAITIASVSLPAGEWDIVIQANFTGTATAVSGLRASISTATNTEVTTAGNFSAQVFNAISAFATFNPGFTVGPVRVSLSGTTTYYFVARGDFSGGTCTGFGVIRATRPH